jgi:prolyl 4-hydroxylase
MDEPVKIIENFLSPEDCKYLINTYDSKVFKSRVVINDEVPHSSEHPSRTSSTCFIPRTDRVIINLRKKVSEFLNVNPNNIEGIQFLRYKKGEKYKWHHDFLKSPTVTNQRTDTILVYLNDLTEEDGGETAFFYYKKKVTPKEGRAVWFKNCDNEAKLIKESLHAGEEIKTDVTKYALNIWIRQKPL